VLELFGEVACLVQFTGAHDVRRRDVRHRPDRLEVVL
jgi:hypothetical protein